MESGRKRIVRELRKMIDTLPTLGETEFTMRHYQESAIQAASKWLWEDGQPSGIIQLATGLGKTPMAGELLRRAIQSGRVQRALFLAHRDELITQACRCFERSGLSPGREQGQLRADSLFPAQVVVSTVQTLSRRMEQWPKDEFQIIVQDECHRGAGQSFQSIYDYYSGAKLLGITATIDRADKKGLDRFTEVIYRYTLMDALRDPLGPFLSPVQFYRIDLGADLRKVRTIGKKGDFNQGDLGKAIEPYVEKFANSIADEIGKRKTIVFMPCVGSATAMASALNQLGVKSEWVSGDRKDKRHIITSYKENAWQCIVNCDMLGEGFDDPATECVVLKPTRSRIAYAQMVGRGTRLFPGKSFCTVIDFNHTSDMDLIGPGSLAELDTEVADEVTKIVKEDKGVSLWDAVEKAKDRVKKKREELAVSIAKVKQTYRKVVVDPFQAASNLGVLSTSLSLSDRATSKQVELLSKWGVATPESLTKPQASRMIGAMIERRKAGLCSLNQLNTLVSLGVKPYMARNMTFSEASAKIDQLLRNK